jgi:transposase
MRGSFEEQGAMFSYMTREERVPACHRLRSVRGLVRDVLSLMDKDFRKLYAKEGRPSIPPEQLLSALLLQVFYGVRSERLLMEQMGYNLLFRWFVGLPADGKAWDATTFTKNRERLPSGDVFNRFMTARLHHEQVKPLLSDEHVSVDGTLIEAWASHKSFRPKDGSATGTGADLRGTQRKNDTHESVTDPDSRLYRKSHGQESRLCYMGHAVMENRHGLAVTGAVTQAAGTAERDASLRLLKPVRYKNTQSRITVGADKNYDTRGPVAALRKAGITPHVAMNETRNGGSAIDARTTRHPGYGMS